LTLVRIAALIVTFLLAGCTSQSTRPSSADASRPLLAPQTLGAERSASQIVRGALGAREMTINCVVTVKDGAMTIVGLSAMGVRIFTIKYDGQATSVENTLPIPPQLTPERLLADLQLVYWPLAALEKSLAAAGWQISESAPGTRRLRRDTQLVAEVHYVGSDPWAGRSWLVNLEHGYTLNIESKPL
jgi:Protein of unknown function (DUF3261)